MHRQIRTSNAHLLIIKAFHDKENIINFIKIYHKISDFYKQLQSSTIVTKTKTKPSQKEFAQNIKEQKQPSYYRVFKLYRRLTTEQKPAQSFEAIH
jgi:preprotein translocase subunit Sss1